MFDLSLKWREPVELDIECWCVVLVSIVTSVHIFSYAFHDLHPKV